MWYNPLQTRYLRTSIRSWAGTVSVLHHYLFTMLCLHCVEQEATFVSVFLSVFPRMAYFSFVGFNLS
ncbi:hypothetical protein LX36DRAFT_398918 [Colletotrichum falcatum]|nr:hypothetical protein LX36DRAFT_398918 [Colletotrichum falcatum]